MNIRETEGNVDKGLKSEALKPAEVYHMVKVGGRIKSASLSTDYLYQLASPFIKNPNSQDAIFEVSKRFADFKDKPPLPFMIAFFPRDKSAMKSAFRGSGIYRPTIKTDQGPPGNVGYFFINKDQEQSQLKGIIVKEEGVALPEEFIKKRFDLNKENDLFVSIVSEVQEHYRKGDYREVLAKIIALRELGEQEGIETTRRAMVGREEFFFFRPIQTENEVTVGEDLANAISKKTEQIMSDISRLAEATKYFANQGFSPMDAIKRAHERKDCFKGIENGVLYFQPDVLIRKDGSFDIEKINMPDLGMFLTEIDLRSTNPTFETIKNINVKIKEKVLDVVAASLGREVMLITRPEVLMHAEDTLEQLEIQAIKKGLVMRGKTITVESLDNIVNLPNNSSILLLNVATDNQVYEKLLYRVAKGELKCYPDPFIKLFENQATSFKIKKIEGQPLAKFLQIIAPSALDKKEGVFEKYKLIQKAFKFGGIDSDIVLFSVNGADVPTFRYDVKSFFEVQKAAENAKKQGRQVNSITAIPVPFKSDDAVIYGTDGHRLALFRFMFVKK